MKLVDIVIIVLLIIFISLLVYFSFIKHRGNSCHNCPYYKSCDKSKCFTSRKENELE